jgi:hypothetical protein
VEAKPNPTRRQPQRTAIQTIRSDVYRAANNDPMVKIG